MACKIKVKKRETEFEGTIIDLERFAYDVFVYSAMKFKVPNECICKWPTKENEYVHPDLILVLSRIFLKYQMTERNFFYRTFKSRYESTKFATLESICEILRQVLRLSINKAGCSILHEVMLSLSLISEFILFLYSENCDLRLKELAHFWFQYLSPIKRTFEKAGGITELYKIYSMPKYDTIDEFYDSFIPVYCFPYNDSFVLKCLDDLLHVESNKYFKKITENCSKEEQTEYYRVMHNTVWRDSLHVIAAKHIERFKIPLESLKRRETSRFDSLLGIEPHEELLRRDGVPLPDDPTSPQTLPSTSCEKPTKESRRSREKRQKPKSSFTSSLEKDFSQMDIGSSKSKHLSEKRK